MRITGAPEVIANIKRANARLEKGYLNGLREASALLLRESQTLVPVDTGNLKASGFARVTQDGWKSFGLVGYTAAYALFVHENVEMKLRGQPRPGNRGRYWDPPGRGQSKFLEEPMRRLGSTLRSVIQRRMRIT